MFDVNPLGKDILHPGNFVKEFGHLEIAEVLSIQNFNKSLVEDVKSGKFDCSSKFPSHDHKSFDTDF